VIISHVLCTGPPDADLGSGYFDHLDVDRLQRHHVRCLRELGYEVTLTPVARPQWS
jgi:hypothetical protein